MEATTNDVVSSDCDDIPMDNMFDDCLAIEDIDINVGVPTP